LVGGADKSREKGAGRVMMLGIVSQSCRKTTVFCTTDLTAPHTWRRAGSQKEDKAKAIIAVLAIALHSAITYAQTTAFTYQGHLNNAAVPANGNYEMQFMLFDAVAGGAQVGGTVTNASVTTVIGAFSTDSRSEQMEISSVPEITTAMGSLIRPSFDHRARRGSLRFDDRRNADRAVRREWRSPAGKRISSLAWD
jgi:hypothetical protein